MVLKTSLVQSQRQTIKFSLQLKQSVELLKLSNYELEQLVNEKLDENIMLAIENEEFSSQKIHTFQQIGNSSQSFSALGFDELNYLENIPNVEEETLDSYLIKSLEIDIKEASEFQLATEIINFINDEGYLEITNDQTKEVINRLNISFEKFKSAKNKIKLVDNLGIGSESINEFLDFQVSNLEATNKQKNLLEQFFHEVFLSKKSITLNFYLEQQNVSLNEINKLVSLSKLIHLKPISSLNLNKTNYIIPDAIVKRDRDNWNIFINNTYSSLSINNEYADAIKKGRYETLRDQQKEAKALIFAINVRHSTLTNVIERVLDIQKDFLDHGELSIKPLQMKEISDALEVSESTISRVVQDKYIQTPRGTYPLKFFFASSIKNDGSGKSVTAIKMLIQKLINEEDKSHPLSDEALTSALKSENILIARRTISKYRKFLDIPSAVKRKLMGQ